VIFGLILAGGRSSRFGREKAGAMLASRPLIAWVSAALAGQVARLAVSARAGSEAAAYAEAASLPCLADPPAGALVDGPLAGVLEGLRWAEGGGADWLLTVPCDTPFIPPEQAARLLAGRSAGGAVVRTADGVQPLCTLWPVTALAILERLPSHPPIRRLLHELGAAEIDFERAADFDNLNTPEAFAAAEARVSAGG
jgi:molybdenum cofactor guanylyltransferase